MRAVSRRFDRFTMLAAIVSGWTGCGLVLSHNVLVGLALVLFAVVLFVFLAITRLVTATSRERPQRKALR